MNWTTWTTNTNLKLWLKKANYYLNLDMPFFIISLLSIVDKQEIIYDGIVALQFSYNKSIEPMMKILNEPE